MKKTILTICTILTTTLLILQIGKTQNCSISLDIPIAEIENQLAKVGNIVYFIAPYVPQQNELVDEFFEEEDVLWKTDGTIIGTSMVQTKSYYIDDNDNYVEATFPIYDIDTTFAAINNILFFIAPYAFQQNELVDEFFEEEDVLWKTDGTINGPSTISNYFSSYFLNS